MHCTKMGRTVKRAKKDRCVAANPPGGGEGGEFCADVDEDAVVNYKLRLRNLKMNWIGSGQRGQEARKDSKWHCERGFPSA